MISETGKIYNGKPTTCPYGECDGSEIILYTNNEGNNVSRRCRCFRMQMMKNRLKFASIPAEFENLTIKSFDTEMYGTEANRDIARNLKKISIQYVKRFEEMKKIGKGLYLYGEARGSGKTRLAISIGNALISQSITPVKFVTTLNLLEEIKSTWDNVNTSKSAPSTGNGYNQGSDVQTQSKLLSAIKGIDVLILDDIGTEKPTSWVNETFYNILNDRMTANKVTIFTSNCRIEELQHDSRIVNRIMKMAVPVKFPEESIRTTIARRENEEIIKSLLEG